MASILLTEALLFISYGILRLASAAVCNVLASLAAAIPAYALYRRWVWGLSGRSRMSREVIPFWITTMVGTAVSASAVDLISHLVRSATMSRDLRAAIVDGTSLVAFALLWAARFLILDRWVFGSRRQQVGAPSEQLAASNAS
ncbi:MAG TPA: GtrA family protein [Acidimicrobiales bacterium]|nr:GtrA family protein [Acidimicrobiales bacterium]